MSAASTIGQRIVAARQAKGLNQGEFARLLGISQPSLSDLESGETKRPRADTLMAMVSAGINPDYIMKNKGPILLAEFERSAREQAIVDSMRRLTIEQYEQVESLIRVFRQTGRPGADDPFLQLPPKKPKPGGTQ